MFKEILPIFILAFDSFAISLTCLYEWVFGLCARIATSLRVVVVVEMIANFAHVRKIELCNRYTTAFGK